MKNVFLGLIVMSSLSVSGSNALAGTVQEDMQWLRSALKISRFSDSKLDLFLNPKKGSEKFRLSPERAPWAGNYFAMVEGGVANRWQDPSFKSHSKDMFQKPVAPLKAEEVAKLSPIEKYDYLLERKQQRATEHELVRRGPLREQKPQDWEGFCNGVRCAGILMKEPRFPVEVKKKDGSVVRFEPADLKALAGASYFYVEKYAQIGSPTRDGVAQAQPNAAVFDLTLRYFLAEKGKAFVIDSHLGTEVWNESVVGYERTMSAPQDLTLLEAAAHPTAVQKIQVDIQLETLGEVDIAETNKPTKKQVADGSLVSKIPVKYYLYLAKDGKIVDGAWINTGSEKGVDFAWFAAGRGADRDYSKMGGNPNLRFEVIRQLFRESATPSCKKLFL